MTENKIKRILSHAHGKELIFSFNFLNACDYHQIHFTMLRTCDLYIEMWLKSSLSNQWNWFASKRPARANKTNKNIWSMYFCTREAKSLWYYYLCVSTFLITKNRLPGSIIAQVWSHSGLQCIRLNVRLSQGESESHQPCQTYTPWTIKSMSLLCQEYWRLYSLSFSRDSP